MPKVVEHQPADGDLAQVELSGGPGQVVDFGTLRVEGQRDVGEEPPRLVLHLTQARQVVDLLFDVFHVAVEHGRVRRQAAAVGGGGDLEPVLTVGLGPEQILVHAIGEDLRTASRNGFQAGVLQVGEHLFQGLFRDPLDLGDLDHGEGLQVGLRARLFHGSQHVEVILVWQLGIDAAHHVDLGDRHIGVLAHSFGHLLRRQHVAPLVVRLHVKGAELAQLVAHVGVVDVLVAHVVRRVAVTRLAHEVGQVTQRRQIITGVEAHTVVGTQTLSVDDLGVHVFETGTFNLLFEDQSMSGEGEMGRVPCRLNESIQAPSERQRRTPGMLPAHPGDATCASLDRRR